MNLSIVLKSAAGQGAVFSIAAPAAPWVQSPPSSAPAASALPGAQLAGLQALVVDDDASSGQALADLLRSWGLHVAVAGSVEQACGATVSLVAQGRPPQLLLTDHWLAQGENSQHVVQAVCRALEAGDVCDTYDVDGVQYYEKNSGNPFKYKGNSALSLKIAVLTGDIRPATQHAITDLGWHFAHKPVRPLALRMWLESVALACHAADARTLHLQELTHDKHTAP